jgi:hypothetical protein
MFLILRNFKDPDTGCVKEKPLPQANVGLSTLSTAPDFFMRIILHFGK